MIKDSPLLRHLAAMATALACALLLFAAVHFTFGKNAVSDLNLIEPSALGFSSYYRNSTGVSDVNIDLALKNKKTILLLGTCDLAANIVTVLPHEFLLRHFGIPVLAFGHGGLQSLAMTAICAAHFHNLKNAPVVIIVSMDWFHHNNRGSLFSFLEFLPTPVLAREFFTRGIPPSVQGRIEEFIRGYQSDIQAPSSTIGAVTENDEPYASIARIKACLDDYIPSRIISWNSLLAIYFKSAWSPRRQTSEISMPDWDALMRDADARAIKEIGSNPYGMYASYFTPKYSDWAWPTPFNAASSGSAEIQDFRQLVALMKAARCRPLFVLQGVNPKAYNNLEVPERVINELKAIIGQGNMPVLDLFHEPYHPGLYYGPLQGGDYTWLLTNKAIYEYYTGKKYIVE